ncbi:uncharacterized protein PSFLO_05167 [Pseudozyma flocculosa]|uniref:Uncharacterized protein n=1 Tax=Pseudozyma flocculosa TaxID=84751 RepID=A0A5C3F6N5_9BASI|nr:uncharacterized protein PSFLO_05167 [Pseudozyma flocculosa]
MLARTMHCTMTAADVYVAAVLSMCGQASVGSRMSRQAGRGPRPFPLSVDLDMAASGGPANKHARTHAPVSEPKAQRGRAQVRPGQARPGQVQTPRRPQLQRPTAQGPSAGRLAGQASLASQGQPFGSSPLGRLPILPLYHLPPPHSPSPRLASCLTLTHPVRRILHSSTPVPSYPLAAASLVVVVVVATPRTLPPPQLLALSETHSWHPLQTTPYDSLRAIHAHSLPGLSRSSLPGLDPSRRCIPLLLALHPKPIPNPTLLYLQRPRRETVSPFEPTQPTAQIRPRRHRCPHRTQLAPSDIDRNPRKVTPHTQPAA